MIVLTPTEAATLRAVLERVAAEGYEDSATAVAVLDNGELLLGIGRSWEEFVDTIDWGATWSSWIPSAER